MTELPLPQIDTVIRALGMGLLHSLWQCALIGAVAWLALRTLRHASPQARYAVACAALAACVLWPAAEVLKQWSIAAAPAFDGFDTMSSPRDIASFFATVVGTDRPGGASARLEAALPWLVAVWAAGACLMLLRLAGGLRWVYRLQRDAYDCEDPAWRSRLDRLAQRFGLPSVRLAVFDGTDGPLSIGIWRPMVLVPASLFARMPVEMIEALLAHELAHIRRHDYLANLLQRAAEALLFHHPVAWWLSHRIRHEREQVADQLAAAAIGEPRRLALALYELDRYVLEHAAPGHTVRPTPSLAQAAHGGHLMSRIQSLLRPERRVSPMAATIPVIGLAAACIACFAYAQSAQTTAPAAVAVAVAAVDTVAPRVAVGALVASNTPAATSTKTRNSHETYAFVSADSDRLSMSGETSDLDEIRDARSRLDGDFLWFRRDGKAHVLRDTATVERLRALWAGNAGREAEMKALGAKMEAESHRVEAIARRFEAASPKTHETPRMREAIVKMQALAQQQGVLAQQQATIATTLVADPTNGKTAADAEIRMEALGARMEALGKQMESLQGVIETEAATLEASLAPLAAMEKDMEAATAPIAALGAKMEALGAQHEREMARIDSEIRDEITRAMKAGLTSPAPSGE